MKPFDIEKVKAGASVITRNGKRARYLGTLNAEAPYVFAITHNSGIEFARTLTSNGRMHEQHDDGCDLFMAPIKKEGWVGLQPPTQPANGQIAYTTHVYETKELAMAASRLTAHIVIKIEWEEL